MDSRTEGLNLGVGTSIIEHVVTYLTNYISTGVFLIVTSSLLTFNLWYLSFESVTSSELETRRKDELTDLVIKGILSGGVLCQILTGLVVLTLRLLVLPSSVTDKYK